MNLFLSDTPVYDKSLSDLPEDKLLISTINAHSYNMAQEDDLFSEALKKSDVLLPDGVSIVYALRLLLKKRIKKIAGADLFEYEMDRLNRRDGSCFFLGSSEKTLGLITQRAKTEYERVKVFTYSPPFKPEFSDDDNRHMVELINNARPDVLFIGLTAPKQEKWAYTHLSQLNVGHICCIGAVFDFYAGTVQRAPKWMISAGLEWFYRLIREPKRLWRRYIIGNFRFLKTVAREKRTRS